MINLDFFVGIPQTLTLIITNSAILIFDIGRSGQMVGDKTINFIAYYLLFTIYKLKGLFIVGIIKILPLLQLAPQFGFAKINAVAPLSKFAGLLLN